MKTSVFAFTHKGCWTARTIAASFKNGEVCMHAPARLNEEEFIAMYETAGYFRSAFETSDVMIFVGAAGIAVRAVAPYIKSKNTDPAVICIDERCRYVIPVLSGHIGGANRIARQIAAETGATAVITTATDVNGRFSVDAWATENGYVFNDMKAAKMVSAAILEKDIPVLSDFPVSHGYENGLFPGNNGEIGIYFGIRKINPFKVTLQVIPKCLHVGIGCKKGISSEKISEAVAKTFEENGLDRRAVKGIASVELKSGEKGLLDYAEKNGFPVNFYSAEKLNSVHGSFSDSDFVKSVTGVGCVCERAAVIGAEKLIIPKTIVDGVTIAVSVEKTEVNFG